MEAYTFALISAILSAFAAILEKKILFKEKALTLTLTLGIFNMFLAFFFFFGVDFTKISLMSLSILFIKSLINSIAFLCVIYSLKNLELSEALPLLVLTPGFVAIIAFLFLGEILAFLEIIGLILLLIGVYIHGLEEKQSIFQPFKIFFSAKRKYILFALTLFTLSSIMDKILISKFSPEAYMLIQHIFFAFIFLAVFLYSGSKSESLKNTIKFSGWFILILAVITILYRYAEIIAIKNSSSVALVIAIKRISIFFAVLIGGKLFNEGNLVRRIIATIFLIVGAILIIV